LQNREKKRRLNSGGDLRIADKKKPLRREIFRGGRRNGKEKVRRGYSRKRAVQVESLGNRKIVKNEGKNGGGIATVHVS